MAEVGQIVYNLEDYNNSGGYISTKTSDYIILGTVVGELDDTNYLENRIRVLKTKNHTLPSDNEKDAGIVFSAGGGKTGTKLSKVGIQAPPGTQFVINDDQKTLIVGRTGVYELDEDIFVNALWFWRPERFILDQVATQTALTQGMLLMQAAEEYRAAAIADLNQRKTPDTPEYWDEYKQIQDEYTIMYTEGLNLYISGKNGIYKKASEIYTPDVTAQSRSSFPTTGEEGKIYLASDTMTFYTWTDGKYQYLDSDYEELKNVIVDYIIADAE